MLRADLDNFLLHFQDLLNLSLQLNLMMIDFNVQERMRWLINFVPEATVNRIDLTQVKVFFSTQKVALWMDNLTLKRIDQTVYSLV